MTSKSELRKGLLLLRRRYAEERLRLMSQAIGDRALSVEEVSGARTISTYVSKRDEVSTEPIIRRAIALGKRVLVPITNRAERRLLFSELKDFDRELRPGTFGILEPKEGFRRPVPIEEADVILVPGVAWDEGGHRVGYGMGYYDRCLSALRGDIPTIGLAYEFQVLPEVPADKDDVRVDMIATERRLIRCKEALAHAKR